MRVPHDPQSMIVVYGSWPWVKANIYESLFEGQVGLHIRKEKRTKIRPGILVCTTDVKRDRRLVMYFCTHYSSY